MSWCHKIVIFVPGCLLCPSLQADNGKKNRDWPEAFRTLWAKYPVNLVQMPCPEATFPEHLAGLRRMPHGIQYYKNLDGFQAHCVRLAQRMVDQILAFQQAGYEVSAVVGVEHSPTCAINYIYTHQGTMRSAGLYLNSLMNALATTSIDISYIGVNRNFPGKAVRALEAAILAVESNNNFTERVV